VAGGSRTLRLPQNRLCGIPHNGFDGRGLETERHRVTAPAPDPTNLATVKRMTLRDLRTRESGSTTLSQDVAISNVVDSR
jgi:hypothetical protein